MKNKILIPSVNFHLWEPCNFSCKFCFAVFQDVRKTILPKGHLPKEDALKIVDLIAENGFEKITFVGGEPTLCPWLADLITLAKTKGLTTMIVTNGTGLTENFLGRVKESLDWVVISIDSVSLESNLKMGRSINGRVAPDGNFYLKKIELVKQFEMKLKINTVVNKYNFTDKSIGNFIRSVEPLRWKIFKALRVVGQNDESFDEIDINSEQFESFLLLNNVKDIPYAVKEDKDDMTGTYAMIDPSGRFFDNTLGKHSYGRTILEVGIDSAMQDVHIDQVKFVKRGGIYQW